MTLIRVRLCAEDRKEYGGDAGPLPEELTLDVEALKDLTAGELEDVDRALGLPLAAFVQPLETWGLGPAQLRRVASWLAARQAGITIEFEEWQPRLLRAELTREASAVPPAGTSERSSEDSPSPPSSEA